VRVVYRHLLEQQPEGKDLAYNTVQTLLRLMEKKGLVASHLEGRAFIYTPLYSRDQTAARFLDRVFDGAASQLVASLLQAERIPPEELDRMQALIAEARRRRAGR
jgi:predicted transcriptional regulator